MATYCFAVSEQCPVSASALGYTPSLPANVTLLAIFSIVGIVQLIQGAAWKTWGFMIAFMLGSMVEAFGKSKLPLNSPTGLTLEGYFGRLILNTNPWSRAGYVSKLDGPSQDVYEI